MQKGDQQNSATSYSFDAKGQSLGRLAASVSIALRGKKLASYNPRLLPKITVNIANIDKVKVNEKKFINKIIYHYSGYPGGLKKTTWQKAFIKSPQKLFMKVLRNMIPDNRLRKTVLKNVKFQ